MRLRSTIRAGFGLAAAATALAAAPARAQFDGEGVSVVRTNAGSVDASGWTDAGSVAGAFSVRLPCLFTERLMQPSDTTTRAARLFEIDCKRADGFTFTVMRAEMRGGEAAAEAAMSARPPGIRPGDVRDVTYGGASGWEAELERSGICRWSRVLQFGGDTIVLVAEGPAASCDAVRADVVLFQESLEVRSR